MIKPILLDILHHETMDELLDDIRTLPITQEVFDAFVKSWGIIRGHSKGWSPYQKIMVSISGGSDSDILLDMIERIGHPNSIVHYVFFDTSMEYQATKDHLAFLEQKYGIAIDRIPAKVSVPVGVKKYGQPFLSKQISEYIHRLQLHDFKWEDRPFEELYAEYPRCKAALRWWCNQFGENSRMNINRRKWLKEFMTENPPDFKISAGCCHGAKRGTSEMVERSLNPDLTVMGIRKAEGGVRGTAYSSCYDRSSFGLDSYRPIFWFAKKDKEAYERAFDITHSECYRKYGLDRTGCACCPFGRYFEKELCAAELYEPVLYRAANNLFHDSYEYTRAYRAYAEGRDAIEKERSQ